MQNNRVAKAAKDLLLALINATLLLVAVCLWLAWQVSDTISSAASEFASGLISLEPIREDVRHMTAELAALRADLTAIGQKTGETGSEAIVQLQTRVEGIQSSVSETFDKIDALVSQPEILVDYSIDRSAIAVKAGFGEYWQCRSEELQARKG